MVDPPREARAAREAREAGEAREAREASEVREAGEVGEVREEREQTVSPVHRRTPGATELAAAAEVFGLLSDPTRLQLLWVLTRGEADVTALTEACGAARPAVSQHLAKLRLGGLVQARKDGRRVVYALPDGHLKRLVTEALNRADHVVTGEPWHD